MCCARFMSHCLGYFWKWRTKVTVLVATSGDTGGAVTDGFYDVERRERHHPYPERPTAVQEKQLTTLGKKYYCAWSGQHFWWLSAKWWNRHLLIKKLMKKISHFGKFYQCGEMAATTILLLLLTNNGRRKANNPWYVCPVVILEILRRIVGKSNWFVLGTAFYSSLQCERYCFRLSKLKN